MENITILQNFIDNVDTEERISILYPDKYNECYINFYTQRNYLNAFRRELINADEDTINIVFKDFFVPPFRPFKPPFFEVLAIFLIRNLSFNEMKRAFHELEPIKIINSNNQFTVKDIKENCPFFGGLVFKHLGTDIDSDIFPMTSFLRDLLNAAIRFFDVNQAELLLAELESFKGLPDVQLSILESRHLLNDFEGAELALNKIDTQYKYKAYRLIVIWLSENNKFKELNKYLKKIDRRKSKEEIIVMEAVVSYNFARFHGVEEAIKKYPDYMDSAIRSLLIDNEIDEIIGYAKKYLTDSPGRFEDVLYNVFIHNFYKLTEIKNFNKTPHSPIPGKVKDILIPILDEILLLYEKTDYVSLGFHRGYIYDSLWRLGMKYIRLKETKELPRIYTLLKGSKNKKYLKEEAEKI